MLEAQAASEGIRQARDGRRLALEEDRHLVAGACHSSERQAGVRTAMGSETAR